MAEGAVVGDGVSRRVREALPLLDDALQLGSRVAGVAAVPVLLHQALLDALPGTDELLKVQIWTCTAGEKLQM